MTTRQRVRRCAARSLDCAPAACAASGCRQPGKRIQAEISRVSIEMARDAIEQLTTWPDAAPTIVLAAGLAALAAVVIGG